jgi:hypothetical protein
MMFLSPAQKKLGIVLILVAGILGGGTVIAMFPTASNQGYAPEQPIPFSHKLHAGTNKIACMYCHSGAEKSRHATIPSLNVCMNCHKVVKTDSPWIQKITQAYKDNKPIEWVRVHELPDYVYFPHKRHIAVGLQCETCHGDIKTMERVQQKSALTMGWCMECHRGLTTPQNIISKIYPNLSETELAIGSHPVAATNCSTCHN